jgi:hypothetical protein
VRVTSLRFVGPHLRLTGANHVRVIAAREAAVGRDDHLRHVADFRPRCEQRTARRAARGREIADDLRDAVGVGHGGMHARLGLHDSTRRDQLHRARDLLGRLHRTNPPAQNSFLTTSHALLGFEGLG